MIQTSLLALAPVALGLLVPAARADDSESHAPPQMEIRAINLRGAADAGPYIAATSLRSAVMAACFGENDPDKNPVAIEAFLTVSPKGKVSALSLQSAQGFGAGVDMCVMQELNKARFPMADKEVEMSILLSMGPLPGELEESGRRGR